jgi:translin
LKEMLERMRKHFDTQEKLREDVLEASREVIRASARAIAAVHRGDRTDAEEMLARARKVLSTLAEAVKAEPHLAESGTIISTYQEYCEAALVQALIWDGKLPTPEELDVSYKAYLAALADVTGELRRHALDMIRADEVSEAERMLKLMEEIFELLMEFDYPDAVLPGMRRRQDMVRRVVEKTRGDLTNAIRQQRLENALERAERARQ